MSENPIISQEFWLIALLAGLGIILVGGLALTTLQLRRQAAYPSSVRLPERQAPQASQPDELFEAIDHYAALALTFPAREVDHK